jgi:hypothetical protein
MVYLIDYENVKKLTGIGNLTETDIVLIFFTKNANSLTFEEHFEIQQSKAKIECKNVLAGNNALDFQLSSYLGFLIGKGFTNFTIISKDTGFKCLQDFWLKEQTITILQKSSLSNEEPVEKTTQSVQQPNDLEKALKTSSLKLTSEEIKKIVSIVNQYKTRQTINSNLQKYFKDNEKVGEIYKILKPFLKGKK